VRGPWRKRPDRRAGDSTELSRPRKRPLGKAF
jgi:hypothetical protein